LLARRTGRNPLVLPKDDSVYGLLGKYFKVLNVFIFLYVFLYAFLPDWREYFLEMSYLDSISIKYLGLLLMLISIVWTILAQLNMKDSWKIGIEENSNSALITKGLFSISRNPIFLGITVSMIGLFLVSANALSLMFLVVSYILIQIQIRLEEAHLIKQFGEEYNNYKNKTRRMI
jgi:protein-S-isoprenylcysteine O-methyltransferase Ste14